MAFWKAFTLTGQTYDLSHLDPLEHTYVQAATLEKPERRYRVWVRFGHHCFTEGHKAGDDPAWLYPDPPQDRRTFNQLRWELSQSLPDLVRGLLERKCFHTGHGNFFTLEWTDSGGQRLEYEVYFELTRDPTDKRLRLVVTSAFPRDPSRLSSRPKTRPIRFEVILFNVQTGKPIRTQR